MEKNYGGATRQRKKYDMIPRFDTIHERGRQQERQIDSARRHIAALMHSIARQKLPSIA